MYLLFIGILILNHALFSMNFWHCCFSRKFFVIFQMKFEISWLAGMKKTLISLGIYSERCLLCVCVCIFILFFYWDITDIEHCGGLNCTKGWFDAFDTMCLHAICSLITLFVVAHTSNMSITILMAFWVLRTIKIWCHGTLEVYNRIYCL